MFDPDLIRNINLGRCFVLIGSGPSTEMGYPSWERLAKEVWEKVLRTGRVVDQKSFDEFISRKDYPAALRHAEVALGSRDKLVAAVKETFKLAKLTSPSPIYQCLAEWPFACYLTTNFDDELQKHLKAIGLHFDVISNTVQDLALLRDGVSHIVVKIHADFSAPSRMVLTSTDYDRLVSSPAGEPFRARLQQLFGTFNILIVGHSMRDPDLQLILSTAKHTASALHPIYMILANATAGDEREFREKYNIRLLSYEDNDHSHKRLKSMLFTAARFIPARGDYHSRVATRVNEEEVADAMSILIYRQLRTLAGQETIIQALGPLVLKSLSGSSQTMTLEAILASSTLAPVSKAPEIYEQISHCLEVLKSQGLINRKEDAYIITSSGTEVVASVAAQRSLEEKQAFGQFRLSLEQKLPGILGPELDDAVEALRQSLITSFKKRGLSMANMIIGGQSSTPSEFSDLFKELTQHSRRLKRNEMRNAFIEAGRDFLVEPTEPQKKYLASISQGYFLYHLAGLDPSCRKIRRNLFLETCWILDASVLLPLLARGCNSHEYAADFFGCLREAKAVMLTTPQLISEIWHHLKWAIDFVKGRGIDSPEFLMAAIAREGFKQNLFIDGYIRLSADGDVGTFTNYLDLIFPKGTGPKQVEEWCESLGIVSQSISGFAGFEPLHWADIEALKQPLSEQRKLSGTFRGEYQIAAEAEALVIIRLIRSGTYKVPGDNPNPLRAYFVSQSRALDRISPQDGAITWNPESLYRYAISLPGGDLKPELLQQCMLHEFYYAGVAFIDKPRYRRFFGPAISQAKLDYKDQRDKFLNETEQQSKSKEYDEAFENTPDFEKPFFVGQMGWELARKVQERATRSVETAKERAAIAEEARRTAERRALAAEKDSASDRKRRAAAEHEANRQRNLKDPKHLQKRLRQAKDRARKKR